MHHYILWRLELQHTIFFYNVYEHATPDVAIKFKCFWTNTKKLQSLNISPSYMTLDVSCSVLCLGAAILWDMPRKGLFIGVLLNSLLQTWKLILKLDNNKNQIKCAVL